MQERIAISELYDVVKIKSETNQEELKGVVKAPCLNEKAVKEKKDLEEKSDDRRRFRKSILEISWSLRRPYQSFLCKRKSLIHAYKVETAMEYLEQRDSSVNEPKKWAVITVRIKDKK